MAFWRWRRPSQPVLKADAKEAEEPIAVKEVVSQVLSSERTGISQQVRGGDDSRSTVEAVSTVSTPRSTVSSVTSSSTTSGILRAHAGMAPPASAPFSRPIEAPTSSVQADALPLDDLHDAEEMFDAWATPLGTSQHSSVASSPRVSGLSDALEALSTPGNLQASLLTKRILAGDSTGESVKSVHQYDVGFRPIRRAFTTDEPRIQGGAGEPAVHEAAEILRSQPKSLQRRNSVEEVLVATLSSGDTSDSTPVSVSHQQIQALEACLEEMEAKCAELSTALGSKNEEADALKSIVNEVREFLQQQQERQGSSITSVKDSLHRSKEKREQLAHLRQHSKHKTFLGASSSSSVLSGSSTPQPLTSGAAALSGPQALSGLPRPQASIPSTPGSHFGVSRSQRSSFTTLAELQGAEVLSSRSLPLQQAHQQARAGAHQAGVLLRGPQAMELSGRMGDGLLMPVNDYQTLDSRKNRASMMGSCFLGFPALSGLAGRRPGQKGSRQQRWMVDNGWMEALRKEFMDLHVRLEQAEARSAELEQVNMASERLEEQVLGLIEAQERHGDELDKLITKVAKLNVSSSPNSSPGADD